MYPLTDTNRDRIVRYMFSFRTARASCSLAWVRTPLLLQRQCLLSLTQCHRLTPALLLQVRPRITNSLRVVQPMLSKASAADVFTRLLRMQQL
jgi:hypothetical protein